MKDKPWIRLQEWALQEIADKKRAVILITALGILFLGNLGLPKGQLR
ncbi:hypothetical protein K0I63_08270 [Shewanella rhizosphaerae]|nr:MULTISPECIES: hypothetical protein [Shewanella]QYJ99164.1 hypothetical protein K0J45_08200 [Shewanella alkalitolerans]QYK14458.1 hypothetical protein K0I63_08270 [Shewanella rhizosphaerae]